MTPSLQSQAAPVVAIHGINREAEQMAHLLADAAEVSGRTVIVPHFDRQNHRYYQRALSGPVRQGPA